VKQLSEKAECVTTFRIALTQMKSSLSDEVNKPTRALGSASNKEKLDHDQTVRECQIN